MKIFFSEFNTPEGQFLKDTSAKNYLVAFQQRNLVSLIEKYSFNSIEDKTLIIDNGAFSVWKSSKPQINIDNYIEECFKIQDKFKFKDIYFIALDEIPGEFGRKPTEYEKEKSVEYTIKNYDKMYTLFNKRALPVFHQHENLKYLDYYLSKTDFLCISPANDENNKSREQWLDGVYLKLDVMQTKIKTHGLAVTGKFLLEKYPWYSVDSISWKAPTLYGRLNLKEKHNIVTIEKNDLLKKLKYTKILKTLADESLSYNKKYNTLIPHSIDTYLWLENYITDLWEERGLKWN